MSPAQVYMVCTIQLDLSSQDWAHGGGCVQLGDISWDYFYLITRKQKYLYLVTCTGSYLLGAKATGYIMYLHRLLLSM
jgi:hypothetical protein